MLTLFFQILNCLLGVFGKSIKCIQKSQFQGNIYQLIFTGFRIAVGISIYLLYLISVCVIAIVPGFSAEQISNYLLYHISICIIAEIPSCGVTVVRSLYSLYHISVCIIAVVVS
ncbi:MAG: DUF2177 family protein [Ruminococcaceae bacterium]|nr:DUF2177 family protein [Oscillospiraceae bacterium]